MATDDIFILKQFSDGARDFVTTNLSLTGGVLTVNSEKELSVTDAIDASIQVRRGTEADLSSIILDEGELAYTTDTKLLFVGDNVTAGGVQVGLFSADSFNNLTPTFRSNNCVTSNVVDSSILNGCNNSLFSCGILDVKTSLIHGNDNRITDGCSNVALGVCNIIDGANFSFSHGKDNTISNSTSFISGSLNKTKGASIFVHGYGNVLCNGNGASSSRVLSDGNSLQDTNSVAIIGGSSNVGQLSYFSAFLNAVFSCSVNAQYNQIIGSCFSCNCFNTFSTIIGGYLNKMIQNYSPSAAESNHNYILISDRSCVFNSSFSGIIGGEVNKIGSLETKTNISGEPYDRAYNPDYSTIIGGSRHCILSCESQIIGGCFNKITADRGTIIGGERNNNDAKNSVIIGSDYGKTFTPNEIVHSSGTFFEDELTLGVGDAETRKIVLMGKGSESGTSLLAGGLSGERIYIPDSASWNMKINSIARNQDLNSTEAVDFKIVLEKNALGAVIMDEVKDILYTDSVGDDISVDIFIDEENGNKEYFDVIVTGSENTYWVANVDITQINFEGTSIGAPPEGFVCCGFSGLAPGIPVI